MEDVVSAKILRIRTQIEKLIDEVFHLIDMERELIDRYIKLIKLEKFYENLHSEY